MNHDRLVLKVYDDHRAKDRAEGLPASLTMALAEDFVDQLAEDAKWERAHEYDDDDRDDTDEEEG